MSIVMGNGPVYRRDPAEIFGIEHMLLAGLMSRAAAEVRAKGGDYRVEH